MKITLKLYACLGKYLPVDVKDNTTFIDIEENDTVLDVIGKYHLPEEMIQLVLLNGVYLYPEQRTTSKFSEGDALAIWPPVAGG